MKIAPLLARYFFSNNRLDMPGVGSFFYDGPSISESEPAKIPNPESLRFISDPSVRESEQLVNYVSSQTGKIKPLAAADLVSFWEQARQFLHIGKPFELEGVGSILKAQTGDYQFTPGLFAIEKLADKNTRLNPLTEAAAEETPVDYKSILYLKKIRQGNGKKIMVIFLLLAGLGGAIFAGYLISRKNAKTAARQPEAQAPPELVASKTDTLATGFSAIPDSAAKAAGDLIALKFVIEKAKKERALKRYYFLHNNGLAVRMSTSDSIDFLLYFAINVRPSDSTHVLDSLQNFYTPVGKKAFIVYD